MGANVQLKAADGHTFEAYVAKPAGKAIGGIVLIQEIFGVNSHIQQVADMFASEGFMVVAPPTMSRIEANVNLGYTEADIQSGFKLKTAVEALPSSPVMLDLQAAVDLAKEAGKVAVVGYCWGGLLTWRSAATLNGLSAAVPYYGGGVPNESNLKPTCPVLAHFADEDSYIPLESVEEFGKAHPEVEIHIYQAHHGFNCDQRGSYNEVAAKLAKARTLEFLKKHLG